MSNDFFLNEEFVTKSAIFAKQCAKEFVGKSRGISGKGSRNESMASPLLLDFAKLIESDGAELKQYFKNYTVVDVVAEHLQATKKLVEEEQQSVNKPAKNFEFDSLAEKDITELKSCFREDFPRKIESNVSPKPTNTNSDSMYGILFSMLGSHLDRLVLNHVLRDSGSKPNKKANMLSGMYEESVNESKRGQKRSLGGEKKNNSNVDKSSKQMVVEQKKYVPIDSTNAATSVVSTEYDSRGKVLAVNTCTEYPLLEADAEKFKIMPTYLMKLMPLGPAGSRVDLSGLKIVKSTLAINEALKKLLEELVTREIISEASTMSWEKLWLSVSTVAEGYSTAQFSELFKPSGAVAALQGAVQTDGSSTPSGDFYLNYLEDLEDSKKVSGRIASTLVGEVMNLIQHRVHNSDTNLQDQRKSAYDRFAMVWDFAIQSYIHSNGSSIVINGVTITPGMKIDRNIIERLPPAILRIVNPFDGTGFGANHWDWVTSYSDIVNALVFSPFGIKTDQEIIDPTSCSHPFVHLQSIYNGKGSLENSLPPCVTRRLDGKDLAFLQSQLHNSRGNDSTNKFSIADSIDPQCSNGNDDVTGSFSKQVANMFTSTQSSYYADLLAKAQHLIDRGHNVLFIDKTHKNSRRENTLHKCMVCCDLISTYLENLTSYDVAFAAKTDDRSNEENQEVNLVGSRRKKLTFSTVMPPFGPILIVTRVMDLSLWEEYVADRMCGYEVIPYYGVDSDRELIRCYFSNENFYLRQSPCHIIVTNYETLLLDLHHLKNITYQQIVFDESWGLFSRSNKYGDIAKALMEFKCRNRIFISNSISMSDEVSGTTKLPDMLSTLSAIFPDINAVLVNEHSNLASTDPKMYKYIRRLLAGFTVVLDHTAMEIAMSQDANFISSVIGVNPSSNMPFLTSDLLAWLEWSGIVVQSDENGVVSCRSSTVVYTDDFSDEELATELSGVNLAVVGMEGANLQRTFYNSALLLAEKAMKNRSSNTGGAVKARNSNAATGKTVVAKTSKSKANSKSSNGKNDQGALMELCEIALEGLQSDSVAMNEDGEAGGDAETVEGDSTSHLSPAAPLTNDDQIPIAKRVKLEDGSSMELDNENNEESNSGMSGMDVSPVKEEHLPREGITEEFKNDLKDDMDSEDDEDDENLDDDMDMDGEGESENATKKKKGDGEKSRTYTRTSSLPLAEEKLKSIAHKGSHWHVVISMPGRQRFLGIFSSEKAAEAAFDEAYRQRAIEIEWNSELKKRKSLSRDSTDRRGNKRIDNFELADKQWETKILAAKRKSRSRNSIRADVDELLHLLDDDYVLEEIATMAGPQLSSGKGILEWVSCSEVLPSSLALLVGPHDFSSLITCQKCILGRASETTTDLLHKMCNLNQGKAVDTEDFPGAQLDFGYKGHEVLHIGDDLNIDELHCMISWNSDNKGFELVVLSSLGVFVNGELKTPTSGAIPLPSRTKIQVGSKIFYFLLPLSSTGDLALTPLQQRCQLLRALLGYLEYRDGPILPTKNCRPKCISIPAEGTSEFLSSSDVTVATLSHVQIIQFQDMALSNGYRLPNSTTKRPSPQMNYGAASNLNFTALHNKLMQQGSTIRPTNQVLMASLQGTAPGSISAASGNYAMLRNPNIPAGSIPPISSVIHSATYMGPSASRVVLGGLPGVLQAAGKPYPMSAMHYAPRPTGAVGIASTNATAAPTAAISALATQHANLGGAQVRPSPTKIEAPKHE